MSPGRSEKSAKLAGGRDFGRASQISAMVLAQDPARFTQDVFSVSFARTMMVPSYQHQGPGEIYLGIPVFVRLLRVTSPDEFLPTLKVKHTQ